MDNEGPLLETLTHRLAECPPEFLLPPRVANTGEIDVAALVADHFRALGLPAPAAIALASFRTAPDRVAFNRLRLVALATWLLHDPWFLSRPPLARHTWLLLTQGLDRAAAVVKAEAAVTDPDRREELVRLCLRALGLRPSGESIAQATDRLNMLDSVERERVLRQSREAEARARQIREAMARRAAEQAATRYSPE